MKNLKNIKLLSFLFFIGLIATSCVHDDDFGVPEINVEEPNVNVNFNIVAIKDLYRGFEPKIIESGDGSTDPLWIEAYVVSSDESGNFYKSLVVQDAVENPTAGIAISTNATDLYTKYEPGRKIYFRVDGLYSGVYAGLPTLGTQDGDQIGRMDIKDFEARIKRSQESFDLVPTVLTIAQAKQSPEPNKPYLNPHLNTLIKFEGVQFPAGLAGEHYGNLGDTYSVNRLVEDCDKNTIDLRTSGFSNFKNYLLPEGNGSLTTVLSVFNKDYQIFIRDTADVQMNGERCNQGGGTGEALTLPFTEDFEGQAAGTGTSVNIPGWTNVNVNEGSRIWEIREFDNNKYAQTSAFKSNENPFETWLVTPGLILPEGSSPTLTFGTKDGFYTGNALTIKISTDFTGDVTSATWNNLNATISSGNTDGYGASFVPSGNIDLSAYAGKVVYIAYQYLGASDGTTTTYQIDNVSVVE